MMIIIWMLAVQFRVVNAGVRRLLSAIGGMLIFWNVLQTVKYTHYLTPMLQRLFWYSYYIPILSVPLFCFYASLYVGKPDYHKLPLKRFFAIPILVLLSIGFLTNDIHQWAFGFKPDFENFASDYSYGPLYFIAVTWCAVFLITALIIVYKRCSVSIVKKYIWGPAVPPLLGSLYLLYYVYASHQNIVVLQLPDVFSFMIMGLWEACILIGLFSSNALSRDYFRRAHLAAQISDRNGRVVYHSGSAAGTPGGPYFQPDENTVLQCRNISGGTVYWTEDITEINHLKDEILDVNRRLAESADLLEAENRLKEERTQISEQNRIYEEINSHVSHQTQMIAGLVREAEQDENVFARNMTLTSFYTVYIKRTAYLMLRAAGNAVMPSQNLTMCVRESLDYLRRCGVNCHCQMDAERMLRSLDVQLAYDTFEHAVEASLPELNGVIVSDRTAEDSYRLRITLETKEPLNIAIEDFPGVSVEREDDAIYLSLTFACQGGTP
ncbi:MAG: hypothetical protein MJ175_13180 [Clostridia bacterium]|nr:hypothetical protein [Clostridia bacterium]